MKLSKTTILLLKLFATGLLSSFFAVIDWKFCCGFCLGRFIVYLIDVSIPDRQAAKGGAP